MNNAQIFDEFGCLKVTSFVESQTIVMVSKYLENKIRRGDWRESVGEKTISKLSCYADPLIEVLLEQKLQEAENLTGKELIPTYSYARVYQPGEKLEPHVDRHACEISITVNVATKGEFSPIFLKYKEKECQKFSLHPGDAVIYKGCEAVHWREPLLENQLNVQFMLHYVDKNGAFKEHAKDKRLAYGMLFNQRN